MKEQDLRKEKIGLLLEITPMIIDKIDLEMLICYKIEHLMWIIWIT